MESVSLSIVYMCMRFKLGQQNNQVLVLKRKRIASFCQVVYESLKGIANQSIYRNLETCVLVLISYGRFTRNPNYAGPQKKYGLFGYIAKAIVMRAFIAVTLHIQHIKLLFVPCIFSDLVESSTHLCIF